MAITLDDFALIDSRFDVLAQELGCSRGDAIERLAKVWHQAMQMGVDRLPQQLIAPHLACEEKDVVRILCDRALLGELLERGHIRLRGGSKKRLTWLAEKRGEANAGGQVRASRGRRRADGTFEPRDIKAEILEQVSAQPLTRSQLCEALRCRRQRLLGYIHQLLAAGAIVELEQGRLMVAEPAELPPEPAELPPEPAELPPELSAEPSPLTLTPAPTPAPEKRARRRSGFVQVSRLAQELCEEWKQLGQEAGQEEWQEPAPSALESVQKALDGPDLAGLAPARLRHGLAMLAAEADERRRLGIDDATRWLRDAWRSPSLLAAATGVVKEQAARARARSQHRGLARAGPGSITPVSHDFFQEAAAAAAKESA